MVLTSVSSCTCREQPWSDWFNLSGKRFYRHAFWSSWILFLQPIISKIKRTRRNQCAVFYVPHWLSSPCSFSGAISCDCSKAVLEHMGKQCRNNVNLLQWNLHYAKVALIQLRKKTKHLCIWTAWLFLWSELFQVLKSGAVLRNSPACCAQEEMDGNGNLLTTVLCMLTLVLARTWPPRMIWPFGLIVWSFHIFLN